MTKKKPKRKIHQNSLANLRPIKAQPGNTTSVKHGAYSEKILTPLIDTWEQEILEMLERTITEEDRIIVRNLARIQAQLERYDWYLEKEGITVNDKEGGTKLNPVLRIYFTCLETSRRHLIELGLAPSTKGKYKGEKTKDFAERMAQRQKDKN